nr:uncharacterized protein LOC113818301 [Penaeus vannamei]
MSIRAYWLERKEKNSITFRELSLALKSRTMVEWSCREGCGSALLVTSVTRISTTRTTSGSTCEPILGRSHTCVHSAPIALLAQISCVPTYTRSILTYQLQPKFRKYDFLNYGV